MNICEFDIVLLRLTFPPVPRQLCLTAPPGIETLSSHRQRHEHNNTHLARGFVRASPVSQPADSAAVTFANGTVDLVGY